MRTLLVLTFAASAAGANAATPESYTALDRASAAACRNAAGLRNPMIGAPTRFSDRFAVDARVVAGVWPQKHMKGARATFLCLYNRRTKRAEVQELATVQAPRPAPIGAIRDIRWQVAMLDGQRPIGSRPLTMTLGSDGKIGGNSGCNGYSVNYRLIGSTLKVFSPIVGTEIACAPDVMAQEDRFRAVLLRVAKIDRTRDGALMLSASDGRSIRFTLAPKG